MLIKSSIHEYAVEEFPDLKTALHSAAASGETLWLIDHRFYDLYAEQVAASVAAERMVLIDASEIQKSFEALAPIFLKVLQCGIKRDWTLVVVGGGILQDIGCFISSVLFRGLRWELLPTTLLAQADSCIGSKSSINIGSYKNQLGTFYPPHRVLLTTPVLQTLPWDEIRSGLGEVIKLQLLSSERDFEELRHDLAGFEGKADALSKWVSRSLAVKQPYIEADEMDRGVRGLLNYGHTFGHAYESATEYKIPHGIAVTLGILTATFISTRFGMVPASHYQALKKHLARWHEPFGVTLRSCARDRVFKAIRHDKKNSGSLIQCILTRGPGAMEKKLVSLERELIPALDAFFDQELS